MTDWHWDATAGTMRPGLNYSYEELLSHRDSLDAQIDIKLREIPMLKGTGFIVIAPSAPRLDGEEHADIEEAKLHGSDLAYQHGVAIVYAPVAIMRPRRETVDSVPSKLLTQLQLDRANLKAGDKVK